MWASKVDVPNHQKQMSKRNENRPPKPLKSRNSLVVYVDKRRIFFGNYDDPASWKKYAEFCEKWKNGESGTSIGSAQPIHSAGHPPNVAVPAVPGAPALVGELVTQFLEFAKEAKNPSDYSNYHTAGQALWQYKELPTAAFDAYLLLQIQGGFAKACYARTHCNKLVNFIVHAFRWGEVRRLVPPGKSAELKAIEPLKNGRETDDRMPVDHAVVKRTLPYLLPVYQAFIKILQATGARPSEICRMKVSDIDRTDPKIWLYRVWNHKTARYHKRRILAFGRAEQNVLLPYLDKKDHEAVFSPKDAVRERKERDREARTTPFSPSQVKRDKYRKRNPKVKINEHFDTATVGKVLKRTILEANRDLPPDKQIEKWTMYQLRHAFLTEKTEQFDENVAALLAGHSNPKMVREIYDKSQERRIIRLKRQEDEQGEDDERVAS